MRINTWATMETTIDPTYGKSLTLLMATTWSMLNSLPAQSSTKYSMEWPRTRYTHTVARKAASTAATTSTARRKAFLSDIRPLLRDTRRE